MSQAQERLFRPRRFAIACAAGAVLLGLAYLALAGAPFHYLAINGAAFLIGFSALAIADHFGTAPGRWNPVLLVGAAALLLATALLGQPVDGAARWVRVGALFVQPTLIVLPPMILAYARASDWVSTAGMIAAAAALAVQPDRAMAGVLAFGLVALAALRPDRATFMAAAAAIAGFTITVARPDRLPAVPYVDQILYSAFDVHPLAGLAVVGGSVLLVLPAIAGWSRDPANRNIHILLGVIWAAIVLASALGNYPTPLVGYGGSAIIGYLLCLASLPKLAGRIAAADASAKSDAAEPRAGDHVRRAAASSA